MLYAYAVVEFLIDQTVEVVPTSWLKDNDKVCLWPTLTAPRLMKAVKNKEPLAQDLAVEEFTAKVLYRTDSYDKAREKLSKSEYCSDLQTDQEKEQTRQRRRNPRYESDTDSAPNDDATARVSKPITKQSKRAAVDHGVPPAPTFPRFESIEVPVMNSTDDPIASTSTASSTDSAPKERSEPPSTPSTSASSLVSGRFLPSPNGQRRMIAVPRRQGVQVDQLASPIEKLLLTSLEEVKLGQKNLDAKVESILAALNAESDGAPPLPEAIELPLETLHDVDHLENLLSDQAIKKPLIRYLASLGGRTLQDAVRGILAELMTDKLAGNFNWIGRGQKRGFSQLRGLHKVVRDATRKNTLFAAATEHKINEAARGWFKYAGDRGGGRAERAKKARVEMEAAEKEQRGGKKRCKKGKTYKKSTPELSDTGDSETDSESRMNKKQKTRRDTRESESQSDSE